MATGLETSQAESRASRAPVRCAIEAAMSILGDRWNLLVVRDVLRGLNRFDLLQDSLGISRNILSVRLTALEEAGILARSPIKPGAKRMLYNPTPKCLGLIPVLVAMLQWNKEWSGEDETSWSRVISRADKQDVNVVITNQNGEPVPLWDLQITFKPQS